MKPYFGVLIIACVLFSTNGRAEEYSPYSPAFILQPEQVESSTSIGANWVNAQYSSSPTSSASLKYAGVYASQSIAIGLPNDYEVGAGIVYSDDVSKSPQTINVVTGWNNPAIYANKTWFSNTPTRVKLSLSAIPKTGGSGPREAPSTYGVGISGIYIGPNTLVTAMSLSQYIADKNSSSYVSRDYASLGGNISKEVGPYLISGSLGVIRFQSMIYQSWGYMQPSFSYTAGLGVSRALSENIWAGIGYSFTRSQTTTNISFYQNTYQANSTSLSNSLNASIRILF